MSDARLAIVATRRFHFSHMMCFIIVYEDRVILAHISDEKRVEIANEFREQRKEAGITSEATLADMVKMLDDYAGRYKNLSDVEVLEKHDMNMMIMASDVRKVIFRKSHYDYEKENGKRKEGKLFLLTKAGKFIFTHKYLDKDETVRMELRATFGEMLK